MTFEQAVNDVLQQRKYDLLMGHMLDFREAFQNALWNFFENLFGKINIKMPDMPEYNISVITNIFILFTVLLIIFIIYLIVCTKNKKIINTSKSMEEIFHELKENKLTFEDLIRLSRDYADKKQHRESVRYIYIALLWLFNTKNILSIDLYKTNSQLKRELSASRPQFSEKFAIIVETFNTVWFGHKQISSDSYEKYMELINGLMQEVSGFEK